MKNESGLPTLIVKALEGQPYDPFRVTSVIKPLRLNLLWFRHQKEIEAQQDVSEKLVLLKGLGVHYFLSQVAKENNMLVELSEEILTLPLKIAGESCSLNGTPDLVVKEDDKIILWDYKVTSKRSSIVKPEWVAQTNLYCLLLKRAGIDVDEIKIFQLNADWYGTDQVYKPFLVHNIEKNEDKWMGFLIKQMEDLLTYAETPDDELPNCPSQDTWNGKRCRFYCPLSRLGYCNIGKKLLDNVNGVTNGV